MKQHALHILQTLGFEEPEAIIMEPALTTYLNAYVGRDFREECAEICTSAAEASGTALDRFTARVLAARIRELNG